MICGDQMCCVQILKSAQQRRATNTNCLKIEEILGQPSVWTHRPSTLPLVCPSKNERSSIDSFLCVYNVQFECALV